jgi:diacylglycerol kinase family enzyme
VTLRVDGEVVHTGALVVAAVANGRYFGGGMHVAPEARFDDGLFDVVVVGDVPKRTLLSKLPLLYAGTHLNDPICRFLRGRVIEAEAAPGEVLLDVDGEALGSLPARIEMLPGALAVIGAAG